MRRNATRAVQGCMRPAGGAAGVVVAAVVVAAPLTACSAGAASGGPRSHRHLVGHSVLVVAPAAASRYQPRRAAAAFQTERTFYLGAGRVTKTFTFRERDGVVLRNQLTVRPGVRVVVDARIPGVAGLEVWSWARRNDPALSCRRHGAFDVCAEAEQWCPMPQATWHFRLVKVSGPAGPVRFNYAVAMPPNGFSG